MVRLSFTGTAIGERAAISEAVLTGASALISTTGANSAGVALTAIATNSDLDGARRAGVDRQRWRG